MTDKQKEFIQLRARGYSFNKIADTLHIAKNTAIKWHNQFKDDIQELCQEELQDLYTKYLQSRQEQISLIGDMFLKIKNELDTRNLSECDTLSLIRLELKYFELLKGLCVPIPQGENTSDMLLNIIDRLQHGEISPTTAKLECELYDKCNSPFIDVF